MSAVTTMNTATQTLSMQELCREYMQENPEQADEVFETRLEERKSLAERKIEELRPLCEELPPDALDPVTREPYDIPLVYKCGHAINNSTMLTLSRIHKIVSPEELLECPVCKTPSMIGMLYECIPLEGCVEKLKNLQRIINAT